MSFLVPKKLLNYDKYDPSEYWIGDDSANFDPCLFNEHKVNEGISSTGWHVAEPININPRASVLSYIKDLFPESSNASPDNLLMENLVIDGKEPVESGSTSLFWLKRGSKKSRVFNSILKCEGIVISIGNDEFTAKLTDLNKIASDEMAVFPFNEISDDDKSLITPGAVFYWNVGYEIMASGQKNRSSVIRFRRLPAWTEKDINKAEKKAAQLKELFGW